MAHRRAKAGIPPDRRFQTKPELAWQLIAWAQRQGVPFRSVSMDTLYGRSHELRLKLQYYRCGGREKLTSPDWGERICK